jgi:uncharacterized protein (TIGR02246 family)
MRKILTFGQSLILVSLLTCLCVGARAQGEASRAKDEAAIRAAVASLAEAWAAGDGRAFAKPFAEDADYTVWNGLYIKGREEIARGHDQIFSTFYKGTKIRLDVRAVRFLREDVAVVHAEGRLVKKDEEFPADPHVVPVLVLARDKGRWQIVVFQNLQSRQEQEKGRDRRTGTGDR